MNKLSPVLKWAGGKRQLLSQIVPLVPSDYECYYEPFVGAGAVLLDLQPRKAIINDTNSELINVYQIIKDQPNDLIALLRDYERNHSNDFFYMIRNADRKVEAFEKLTKLEKAARTIYLNRTCYNGLYRVNKHGFFNTPIGHNSSIQIVNEKGIIRLSDYLNTADISFLNCDYKHALAEINRRDFAFLDPPYYPTGRDSFLRYDRVFFGPKEQEELKGLCDSLSQQGIRFIETNSDCPEIRSLYSQYTLIEVDVRRCINAKPDGRRGKELIICNY